MLHIKLSVNVYLAKNINLTKDSSRFMTSQQASWICWRFTAMKFKHQYFRIQTLYDPKTKSGIFKNQSTLINRRKVASNKWNQAAAWIQNCDLEGKTFIGYPHQRWSTWKKSKVTATLVDPSDSISTLFWGKWTDEVENDVTHSRTWKSQKTDIPMKCT